jgi:hypothetical protein
MLPRFWPDCRIVWVKQLAARRRATRAQLLWLWGLVASIGAGITAAGSLADASIHHVAASGIVAGSSIVSRRPVIVLLACIRSALFKHANAALQELDVSTKLLVVLDELLPRLCGAIVLLALLALRPGGKGPGPKVHLDPVLSRNEILTHLPVLQEGNPQEPSKRQDKHTAHGGPCHQAKPSIAVLDVGNNNGCNAGDKVEN